MVGHALVAKSFKVKSSPTSQEPSGTVTLLMLAAYEKFQRTSNAYTWPLTLLSPIQKIPTNTGSLWSVWLETPRGMPEDTFWKMVVAEEIPKTGPEKL